MIGSVPSNNRIYSFIELQRKCQWWSQFSNILIYFWELWRSNFDQIYFHSNCGLEIQYVSGYSGGESKFRENRGLGFLFQELSKENGFRGNHFQYVLWWKYYEIRVSLFKKGIFFNIGKCKKVSILWFWGIQNVYIGGNHEGSFFRKLAENWMDIQKPFWLFFM